MTVWEKTMKNNRRLRTITAGVAAITVLGVGSVATAQAGGGSSSTAATAGSGIPASVNPTTDVAAHTPGSGRTWNDSIYFTSEVKAGGHDFGVLVQTMRMPNQDKYSMTVSVTDEKTGWYKNYETGIAKDDYTWSTSGLNIKMPGLSWTGDAQKMFVKAATPWGSLDLQLKAEGPVMNYAGTGVWDMHGAQQYEFALPSMRTTGTLSVQGRTHKVSGESWLDRQWGPLPQSLVRWTWMNLSLPNGDKVAVWDTLGGTAENAWATVLHPDGSYDLAAVRPLADSAHRFWAGPTSGNTYPTRWRLEIPSLKTDVTVRITGTDAQEITGTLGNRLEGTAAFSGTYEGKKVSGKNYVEMVGNWSAA
ncbi:Hydrolase OS=Streptomyces griseorubiginosus OX=67304 GN=AQJ54_39845 PE=4 SV=1 [Streptomyces griseorubiginosus]